MINDVDMYIYIIKRYEEKLKQLMPPKDYREFVDQVSRENFLRDIMSFEDEDFKKFCLDNIEAITEIQSWKWEDEKETEQ